MARMALKIKAIKAKNRPKTGQKGHKGHKGQKAQISPLWSLLNDEFSNFLDGIKTTNKIQPIEITLNNP